MAKNIKSTDEWKRLATLAKSRKDLNLGELFEADPARALPLFA